ncbi:MAG TPA: cupin domain-containing protein [Acidobacteriaceae bacterium]|jgi:mannose-6-phosphate isomerase-like protein (cupin superfamily)|nr:cupin domain-containing protein [Acidobacteriaceae bacterium]
MHRRRFLQSSAALLPLPLLERAVLAAPPSEPEVHVIPAGQDRLGEYHTLGFSTISFKVLPRETSGGLFLIEHTGLRKGGGPPLHLHYAQDEYFYLMEGTVLFQVGDRRVQLHPGESVLGPRLTPHTFTIVSDQPAHMLIAFTPAGQMEDFFRAAGKPGASLNDPALFASHGMKKLGPPLSAS